MSRPAVFIRLKTRLYRAMVKEDTAGQGRHVDPADPATPPPQTEAWNAARRRAGQSAAMRAFTDSLRPPGGGAVRDGVIADLAEYHGISEGLVVERCLDWEAESVREWQSRPRDTTDGLAEFYDSVESWSFDLLWYAYLQTAGYAYPHSVVVADALGAVTGSGRMLDLGSGAGVTAQMFAALGWEVTLADASATLLTFAQWRHKRRGLEAGYIHLPADLPADLPDAAFDLITALDVLMLVPDIADTAARLHRALRPGGLLVGNFDVRRPSDTNAWHRYEDDLPLRWAIERAGFAPVQVVDGVMRIYRAVPAEGPAARLRTALAWARLASPPVRGLRGGRHILLRGVLHARNRLRSRR